MATDPVNSAPTPDDASDGWAVESESVPDATAIPPDDTTAAAGADEADAAPTPPAVETVPAADAAPAAPSTPRATGAAPEGDRGPSGRKVKKTERYQSNERARHDAERTAADLKRDRDALAARVQALETAQAGAQGTQTPTVAESAAALDQAAKDTGLPPRPKLSAFDTEAEYEAALETWTTAAFQKREKALRASLSTELRAEIDVREQTARTAAVWEVKFNAMRAAHPDFVEKAAAAKAVTSQIKNPFVQDLVVTSPGGAELLYRLVEDLRDALVSVPAPYPLFDYLTTPKGREVYERIRTLPPVEGVLELGRVLAGLGAAEARGSALPVHDITQAIPSARPPAGSPRARSHGSGAGGSEEPFDFAAWVESENKADDLKRAREHGLPPPT